jgi:parvulin-like peptidyl-prolyl isomerase
MRRLAILLLAAAGCGKGGKPPAEPERVEVQHILISFAGTRTAATRTKQEAEKLALEVFEKAKQGGSFDELSAKHSDDPSQRVYTMVNHGAPQILQAEIPRGRMVKAFADLGFRLAVNEIGMAVYEEKESPFGWHIIKRLK